MQGEESESLDAKGNCSESAKLYPEQNPGQDRILEQLFYRPCLNFTSRKGSKLNKSKESGSKLNQSEPLNILLWEGSAGWEHTSLQSGRKVSFIIINIWHHMGKDGIGRVS